MSDTRARIFGLLACALLWPRPMSAAAVPVRFAEGVVHGFLTLRTTSGAVIASGDLLQFSKAGQVESRTVFHFKDGSLSDERVTYTQQGVFTLQSYQLAQRGPAFSDETEISLERSGKYRVKTKARKDGREEVLEGKLDLPSDVYNGMVITVVKNLPKGASETVHYVAFTPQPRLIELELVPGGEQNVQVGEVAKKAVHYLFKPRLGIWLQLLATLFRSVPPDYHAWIIKEDVPAFLRADGPLYMGGPIWRIELTGPRWPN